MYVYIYIYIYAYAYGSGVYINSYIYMYTYIYIYIFFFLFFLFAARMKKKLVTSVSQFGHAGRRAAQLHRIHNIKMEKATLQHRMDARRVEKVAAPAPEISTPRPHGTAAGSRRVPPELDTIPCGNYHTNSDILTYKICHQKAPNHGLQKTRVFCRG